MKKIIRLNKQLTKSLIIAAAVLLGAGLLYMLVSDMQSTSDAELSRLQRQLSFKKTEFNTLANQIENAKEGEQQFLKYALTRNNEDFLMDVADVKRRLRYLQSVFDLSENLKLALSTERKLQSPAFRSLPHTISVRSGAKLSFSTLSDLHVFSLIQALQTELPGIIEFTRVQVFKRNKLNTSALARISTGNQPELVAAELQFNWYSLNSKTEAVK
jgi:hypothetical protein